MKYVSQVLALFGAGLTTTPEVEDTVLTIPPVLMPEIQVYPPQQIHQGFLNVGVARTSFFYGNQFTRTGASGATDEIAVQLATGAWELDVAVAANRTAGAGGINPFFQVAWSQDGGGTFGALWRAYLIAGNTTASANFTTRFTVNPSSSTTIFVSLPASAAGETVTCFLGINGRKLL